MLSYMDEINIPRVLTGSTQIKGRGSSLELSAAFDHCGEIRGHDGMVYASSAPLPGTADLKRAAVRKLER
jgi:hypothetical protein